MERNRRFVAIFAGGAFALSVLSGAIAGVSFGALILRAAIGGVVFGGLALLIQFVFDRFLPEIFSASGAPGASRRGAPGPVSTGARRNGDSEDDGRDAAVTGRNVDIVVEEETEELTAVDDEEEEEEPAELAEAEIDAAEEEDALGEIEAVEEAEPAHTAEGSSPASRESRESASAGRGEATGDGATAESYQFESLDQEDEGADELVEEVEEVTSEEEPPGGPTQTPWHDKATAEVSSSDIDAIPDISGLSDSFGDSQERSDAGREGAASEESGMTDLGGGSSGSSRGRSDQDPETIARAIQTVLRRE
ncbi:MAG: hypothetical protein ACOCYG_03110 [Spirochaetota bacterium]